jgi:glutaredoxin
VYTQTDGQSGLRTGCVLSQVWTETLRRHGVEFVEKNIAADPAAAAELRSLGPLATPTTVIDGQSATGFDRALLELQVAMLIVRVNRDVENDTWVAFDAQYPALAAELAQEPA